MNKLSIICITCFVLSGCSTFKIYDKDGVSKEGVPFYKKIGVIKQTTVYTRTWLEATINYNLISDGKPVPGSIRSAKVAISIKSFDEIELFKSFLLSDEEAAKNGFSGALIKLKTVLKNSCKNQNKNCEISQTSLNDESNIESAAPLILHQVLESNSLKYEAIVDYDNTYYFNSRIPIFGTASGTIKLAEDGTLNEASSSVDNTKIADLIPFKELFIDKWGLEDIVNPKGDVVGDPKNYSLSISIGTNGFIYEISKYHAYKIGMNQPILNFDDSKISISRKKYVATKGAGADKKKNSIILEGAITLPDKK